MHRVGAAAALSAVAVWRLFVLLSVASWATALLFDSSKPTLFGLDLAIWAKGVALVSAALFLIVLRKTTKAVVARSAEGRAQRPPQIGRAASALRRVAGVGANCSPRSSARLI